MAAISVGNARHGESNPGPEPTTYDRMRHESVRLRRNGLYGVPKFFVNGLRPEKVRCSDCTKLLYWCGCPPVKD